MALAGDSKQACLCFLVVALICGVPLLSEATPINAINIGKGEVLEKGAVDIVLGKPTFLLNTHQLQGNVVGKPQALEMAPLESATEVIPLREEVEFYAATGSSKATEPQQQNTTASAVGDVVQDRMLELKLLAVMLIASMSLVGVLPPILGWDTLMGEVAGTPSNHFFRLRGFTAGIMISLALVHIIAEAFELLDGMTGDYPVAAVFIMLGVFIMMLVERISMDILSAQTASAEAQLHAVVCCHSPAHNHAHRPNHTCTHHTHKSNATHELEESLLTRQPSGVSHQHSGLSESASVANSDMHHHCHGHDHAHSHGHTPELPIPPSTTATTAMSKEAAAAQKPIVMVSMLELGIVVHSLVIGMDLGVMTDNRSAMVGLIAALAFHQLFEGLGLGACVAAVRMHLTGRKITLIVALFIGTFPLGVASGVALSYLQGFDGAQPMKVWLQGSLDAVSGGILLYVALVHFIAEDFSRNDVNNRENLWLRWQMMLAVVLGATIMALLALWV